MPSFRCDLSACNQTMCRHCSRITLGWQMLVHRPLKGCRPCAFFHAEGTIMAFCHTARNVPKTAWTSFIYLKPPNAAACLEMVHEA